MHTYQFETVVENGKIILSGLPFPSGEKVQILVKPSRMLSEDDEWERLAAEDFLKGYSDEDSIYDND